MRDLQSDTADLNRQLSRSGMVDGGRIVMFIAARQGDGTSSLAVSSALDAATRVQRPAWLIDLDVAGNRLFNAFAVGDLSHKYGGVGRPYSACLRERPFVSIRTEDGPVEVDPRAFTAHQVGDTKLMVTHFDTNSLKSRQSLQVAAEPAYWAAVRRATDWTVVDAPALETSSAGLAVAAQMDNCIIVASADDTPPDDVADLRDQLEDHGARVTGVVMNRVQRDAMFFDRIWRGVRR